MFKDRTEAGEQLAEKLEKYKNNSAIVLGIPRGGVPVASIVATKLGLPLEVVLTKKIGHPGNKEFAIGAASLTDYFVEPESGVSEKYIEQELIQIRKRLQYMREKFNSKTETLNLKNKTILIIDDGMATGNTLLHTVHLLKKRHPKRIVVAVPVASQSAVELLQSEVDELEILQIPYMFNAVGNFYEDFREVNDEEVVHILHSAAKPQQDEDAKVIPWS
jgi:putative phosphoribosyl transferase